MNYLRIKPGSSNYPATNLSEIIQSWEFSQLTTVRKLQIILLIHLLNDNGKRVPMDIEWFEKEIKVKERLDVTPFLGIWVEIISPTGKVLSKSADEYRADKKEPAKPAKKKPSNKSLGTPFDQPLYFGIVWADYPAKIGRKEAFSHYKTTVKNKGDHGRLSAALVSYIGYVLKVNKNSKSPRPWMNGSTWFNNWSDWENFQEPPTFQGKETKSFQDEQVAAFKEGVKHSDTR